MQNKTLIYLALAVVFGVIALLLGCTAVCGIILISSLDDVDTSSESISLDEEDDWDSDRESLESIWGFSECWQLYDEIEEQIKPGQTVEDVGRTLATKGTYLYQHGVFSVVHHCENEYAVTWDLLE